MDSHQPADFSPYQSPMEKGVPVGLSPSRTKLPLALKVVAWLTAGQGVLSLIGAISSTVQGHFHIDLGVLWIPAGIGLLKLRRGWRTYTLVMIWVMMIVSLFVALVAPFTPGPQELDIPGFKSGPVPNWGIVLGAVFFFLLLLWQYRVLIRRDVKALFGLHGKRVSRSHKM